jgi:methyltransferase (TIGR00027 family)
VEVVVKKQQSSITAEGIAFARAVESSKPVGERVCYDPLARHFISPAFYLVGKLFSGYAQRRSPGVVEFLIARTRYIDDYLQTCLDEGLEQLVILGAGYDSRPYRLAQLQGRVKVFEVDHPATQQVKIAKMRQILGKLPEHVVYVPLDFAQETLAKLLASGYDQRLKTLFIWEGVTYYLPAEAVDSTLAFVAQNSGPGSSIVFDYLYASAITGPLERKELISMRRYQRLTGEGVIFGIEEGTIEEFLEHRGFYQIQNITSEFLKNTYFTGVNRKRVVAPVYALVHATVKPSETV